MSPEDPVTTTFMPFVILRKRPSVSCVVKKGVKL